MTEHHPSAYSGPHYHQIPQIPPATYAYPTAPPAPSPSRPTPDYGPPPGYGPPPDYGPPVGYAPNRRAAPRPYRPAHVKAPGVVLIVLATMITGFLGLRLAVNRAATARRMGLPTRRYWLAWGIPFAFWLPFIVYINVFAHGGQACNC